MRLSARLPNFFVVGAPKTGTTSLYSYLKQHPQIFMSPVKEPSFLADEMRPGNFSEPYEPRIRRTRDRLRQHLREGSDGAPPPGLVTDWEDYERLFQNVRDESAVGEASVTYLWSPTAARNIHARFPQAKIIMILRDPVERAYSEHVQHLDDGPSRATFREEIDRCVRGGGQALSTSYPFLEFGLYHSQVKRYLEIFPREQIRICWYEAWREPRRLLAELFEFLNVRVDFQADIRLKSRERRAFRVAGLGYALKKLRLWEPMAGVVPRAVRRALRRVAFRSGKALVMDPKDREYLIGYYREDVQKLAALLNRDLTGWLQ